MSETTAQQAVQETTPVPAAETTTTVTHYQQLAGKLIAGFAEIVAQVPGLESSHPTTVANVRANKTVPPEFIGTTVGAVESEPELQQLQNFFDTQAARDALQYAEAFKPLSNQVGKFFRDLNFTMDSKKATAGAEALTVYFMSKRIARNPRKASVNELVLMMKRDLNRKRPKARSTETTPPPAGGVATL